MGYLEESLYAFLCADGLDPDWKDKEWNLLSLLPSFDEKQKQMYMNIRLQRKPTYYVINILLPVFLVATVGLTAFAVPIEEFGDRFGILGQYATLFIYPCIPPLLPYPPLSRLPCFPTLVYFLH